MANEVRNAIETLGGKSAGATETKSEKKEGAEKKKKQLKWETWDRDRLTQEIGTLQRRREKLASRADRLSKLIVSQQDRLNRMGCETGK